MATLGKSFHIFLRAVIRSQLSTLLTDEQKLNLLINLVSPAIFKHISNINNYSSAMNVLEEVFIWLKNSIFSRHLLAIHQQKTDESVEQYLQFFKKLTKDGYFQVVTIIQMRYEYIRVTFINRISARGFWKIKH